MGRSSLAAAATVPPCDGAWDFTDARRNHGIRSRFFGNSRSFLPGAEQAAQVDQLPEVVRVVVGYEQGFTQDGLAVSPWNARQQISLGIRNQILHRFQILAELLNAFVPRGCARRSLCFWPVSLRPFGRLVFAVAAEFENIPLPHPKLPHHHPSLLRH